MSEIGKLIHIFSIHARARYRGSRRYFHFACLTREERNPPPLRIRGMREVAGAAGAKNARARGGEDARQMQAGGGKRGALMRFICRKRPRTCVPHAHAYTCVRVALLRWISQFSEARWSAIEAIDHRRSRSKRSGRSATFVGAFDRSPPQTRPRSENDRSGARPVAFSDRRRGKPRGGGLTGGGGGGGNGALEIRHTFHFLERLRFPSRLQILEISRARRRSIYRARSDRIL